MGDWIRNPGLPKLDLNAVEEEVGGVGVVEVGGEVGGIGGVGGERKVKDPNQPRYLSEQEMEDILKVLALPPAADPLSAQLAHAATKASLLNILENEEVSPSLINTDPTQLSLSNEILRMHNNSIIAPGTPTGIADAEAVGSKSTQMTLNTFHASGSSKSVSFGIDGVRDMIFARKQRKNESCTIYFRNTMLTFADVIYMRANLVGSTVKDFISSYLIDKPNRLSKYWWHGGYQNPMGYISFQEGGVPNSHYALRIFLNLKEMYKQNVKIEQLAAIIIRDTGRACIPVYGPMKDGIIDLYPTDAALLAVQKMKTLWEAIARMNAIDIAEQLFLKRVVYTEFSKLRVKGVKGITAMFPVAMKVWKIVKEEKEVTDRSLILAHIDKISLPQPQATLWWLTLNFSIIRDQGITVERLTQLLNLVGINVVQPREGWIMKDRLMVQVPVKHRTPDRRKPGKFNYIKPGDVINQAIAAERKRYDEAMVALKNDNRVPYIPIDNRYPLLHVSQYIYAETNGGGLLDLLARAEVDPTRTTCNNIHTTANILGIEAARAVDVREINQILSANGLYINAAHLNFIADYTMSRGRPYGSTFIGISRGTSTDHLSLASLERAGNIFSSSALFGKTENINSVSASVVVGKRMVIGTGSFDIGMNIVNELGVAQQLVNDEVYEDWIKDVSIQEQMKQLKMSQPLSEAATKKMQEEHLARNADLTTDVVLREGLEGEEEEKAFISAADYESGERVANPNVRPVGVEGGGGVVEGGGGFEAATAEFARLRAQFGPGTFRPLAPVINTDGLSVEIPSVAVMDPDGQLLSFFDSLSISAEQARDIVPVEATNYQDPVTNLNAS